MKTLILAALAVGLSSAAYAQSPSCNAQAAEKKLAGAAKTSFVTKCEKDAGAACDKQAADKKLGGRRQEQLHDEMRKGRCGYLSQETCLPNRARVVPSDRRETRDPFRNLFRKSSGMDPGSAPLTRLVRDDP
jgi:hypothetical protein